MKQQETTKDYTFLPNRIHKQDLENAKRIWRKELQIKGIGKRQYKYTKIATA